MLPQRPLLREASYASEYSRKDAAGPPARGKVRLPTTSRGGSTLFLRASEAHRALG
jgi:hypothetical protein